MQSASLPGSAGPAATFLRCTFLAGRWRRMALSMASWAMRSASSVCWLSQSEKASLATPETKAAASREVRRSLVCPENCGSLMRSEST